MSAKEAEIMMTCKAPAMKEILYPGIVLAESQNNG